jgi:O-antigen/teichoic acid export membrane protein
MIGYLAGTLLLPMFARLLKSSNELKKLYILSFNLLMVFTLIVAISLVFYRQEIMQLLYKNATSEWGDTFGLLLFSFIGTTLAYVSGCHLMACGKVTKMLRVFILAIVLNIGLNLILIPYFHVRAAAFVAALTQIIILIIQSGLSFREAEIQLPKGFWLRLTGFILLIILVCISVQKFLMITWYYKIVITPIFGVLIAGMFGFLSYKNIQVVVIRFFSRLR